MRLWPQQVVTRAPGAGEEAELNDRMQVLSWRWESSWEAAWMLGVQ